MALRNVVINSDTVMRDVEYSGSTNDFHLIFLYGEITTTTTTTTLLYYFRLDDCTNIGEYAETGPYPDGTYNSGERVESTTDHFYVVSGSQLTTWGYSNITVSHTGFYSCP